MGSVAHTHPSDVPYFVTDNARVRAATGRRPRHSVEDVLDEIFLWLDEHREQLEAVLSDRPL